MPTQRQTKQSEVAADLQLIAGIQKRLSTTSILLNGTSYTGANLVTQIQARVAAVNATVAALATWRGAVKAETEQLAATQALLNALKKAIYTMFPNVADLADFGLSPHKKPVITPAERVAAAAKAKATRVARHTMGSQQKKAVIGAIPGGDPTPPSPVTPANGSASPPTAPAAAAALGTAASSAGTPHA